jgi:prevent-host-death family protein
MREDGKPGLRLVPTTHLRLAMRQVLNEARRGRQILVTRDGDPVAVILGLAEWSRLAPEDAQAALALIDGAESSTGGVEGNEKTSGQEPAKSRMNTIDGWGMPDIGAPPE